MKWSNMEGRPCKGEGRNLSCFSGGFAFTVVIKNMAQILGKISNLNLRCPWHTQIEISRNVIWCLYHWTGNRASLPRTLPQFHPFCQPDTSGLSQLWTREDKSKTTVVPCYKIFLTLANNSLNKMKFWYIYSVNYS